MNRLVSRVLSSVLGVVVVATASGCPSMSNFWRERDDLVVEGDLAYIDDGNAAHKLDLYAPRSVDASTPVIVFVHGGTWARQDKRYWEFVSGVYGNVGVSFAREGFIVANVNYRLFPEGDFEAMVADVDAAVSFIKARFPSSPIVLMGHSAGGHLATAAPLLPQGPHTVVDAIIGDSGIYDIENCVDLAEAVDRVEVLQPLFGDTAAEQNKASTAPLFASAKIPTFFVTGTDDLPAVESDWNALKDALADEDDFGFVEVNGTHEGTILQVGAEDDAITSAAVEFLADHGIAAR